MFKFEKKGDKAVLTIYGYVGGYYMDFRAVKFAIEEIQNEGFKKLDFHLHTYGGSVIDGNLIYNFLKAFDGELHIYVDGVAASMGFIIMLAAKKENTHIASNGLGMFHVPSGGSYGNAKDLESDAKLLRLLEKQFKAVLKERTGKTDEEIEAWFDGADYWFDADELIESGFVGSKFDGKVKDLESIDSETAQTIGAKAAYDRFAALTTKQIPQNNKSKMNKPEVIAKFGLTSVTAESSEDEIYAAIQTKMTAKDSEVQAERKKAIEAAVNGAIADGKITKEQKDEWVLRGEKLGIEDLNAVLTTLQKPQSITDHIIDKGRNGEKPEANREGWDWDRYQKEAVAELEAMPEKDPERFKALFKDKYGSEPEL